MLQKDVWGMTVDARRLRFRASRDADRQLAVWERTGDFKAVVDHIIAETYEGLAMPPAA